MVFKVRQGLFLVLMGVVVRKQVASDNTNTSTGYHEFLPGSMVSLGAVRTSPSSSLFLR